MFKFNFKGLYWHEYFKNSTTSPNIWTAHKKALLCEIVIHKCNHNDDMTNEWFYSAVVCPSGVAVSNCAVTQIRY